MTKVIEGVNVLTYDEWQKRPEVIEMFGTLNECSTCDGEGEDEIEKLFAWRDGLAIKHPSYMGDKHSDPVSIVAVNIHGKLGW